ncbi:MAG: T9SS type A sorting domain-containing protein [Sporocytophaga sp.]|uniref:T9SS type A sorting domain-containing protein n=1 Tax=Sporocytophaga sp. TaxID=2231183 RepID=UPI001B1D4922|nr:T9SS type A sorting domain-containing protein [Sporocytophaga sp.]MBO9703191.1 T9SS type A sorting domain-containing protein [Sporocytophaga sp.]
MKKFFLFTLLYTSCHFSFSANLYSRNDGSWDDPGNWSTTPGGPSCSCLPSETDNVTVNNNLSFTNLTVKTGGSISIENGQSLQGSTITIQGGLFDLQNGQVIANNLNVQSGNINVGAIAQITTSNSFTNYSNGVVVNGTLTSYGTFQNLGYIDGSGFLGHTPFETTGNVNPLITDFTVFVAPVKLTGISYTIESSHINLKWKTIAEKNNAGFEIYKSEDGINFQLIGFQEGKNNTTGITEYIYSLPVNSSCYIKLIQFDNDGQHEDLKTIFVDLSGNSNIPLIYPNPVVAGETVNVNIDNSNNKTSSYSTSIYDLNGSLLKQMDSSSNLNSISTKELKPGTYIVEIVTEKGRHQEYLIVR